MFVCDNIACERGNKPLFNGLGFCLTPGSLLLLKGANGCGKTSLIKILTGLLPATQGEITWKGEKIANNHEFRKDMMYIGHKSGVKQDFTVRENIQYWADMYDTHALIDAAISFFDLDRFEDTPTGNLSAGWQRKVALARLIVVPCTLWILDEPTNFLDDDAVIMMSSLIEARVKQGGIVIIASHIMNSSIAAHTLFVSDYSL